MRIAKVVVSVDRKECAVYLDNGEKLEGVQGIQMRVHVNQPVPTVTIEATVVPATLDDGSMEGEVR
ncbi:hypothetical protein Psp6_00040 [Pseudomonas phage Psp6]|nr:hypothetical protein Psp6_00040 [Pseudomonas phage Psp6]